MSNAKSVSAEVLEVVPQVMAVIRAEMRGLAQPELTIAQFRVLARLAGGPQTNKQLADWIGISAPSMSRAVDVLVERGLVERRDTSKDRREISLTITAKGKKRHEALKSSAREKFAAKLQSLSASELTQLTATLSLLKEIFQP